MQGVIFHAQSVFFQLKCVILITSGILWIGITVLRRANCANQEKAVLKENLNVVPSIKKTRSHLVILLGILSVPRNLVVFRHL